jgi:hypothetical protein
VASFPRSTVAEDAWLYTVTSWNVTTFKWRLPVGGWRRATFQWSAPPRHRDGDPVYAQVCAELQPQPCWREIGQNDLWIAATALAFDRPLVLRNPRHFGSEAPNQVSQIADPAGSAIWLLWDRSE